MSETPRTDAVCSPGYYSLLSALARQLERELAQCKALMQSGQIDAVMQGIRDKDEKLAQAQAQVAELEEAGIEMLKWLDSREVRETFHRMGILSLTHPHLSIKISPQFSEWAKSTIEIFRRTLDDALSRKC